MNWKFANIFGAATCGMLLVTVLSTATDRLQHAPPPDVDIASVPVVNADGSVRWPDGHVTDPTPPSNLVGGTIGLRASVATSPGIVLCDPGTTWDFQHNDANQRMIATAGSGSAVHFTWTHWDNTPDSLQDLDRFISYQCWTPAGGLGMGNCGYTLDVGDPLLAWAGHPTIDVGADGRAHVAFHARDTGQQHLGSNAQFSSQIFDQDVACGTLFFREPLAQSEDYGLIWPHIAIDRGGSSTRTPGDDVFHITSKFIGDPRQTYLPGEISYWRRVGGVGNAWEGPVVLDVIYGGLNHYVAVDPVDDNVAVIYDRGNLDPDQLHQVSYLESPDNGANWIAAGGFPNPIEPIVGPYVNITSYIGPDAINPQAWIECAGDYDLDGVLHAVWIEQVFANETADCRLKHWDEVNGITTVIEAIGWPNTGVDGPRDLWLSLPNIAFGDGSTTCTDGPGDLSNYNYVYVTYQQYGGPTIAEANDTSSFGHQNLDVYLAVSNDKGLLWSPPYNLTNTKTPGCDGTVSGNECASERDPSIAKYVNDTIHISYILDLDAGDIVFEQGSWTFNPVMYYRIPGGTDADIVCPQISPRFSAVVTNQDPDCEYHARFSGPPQQVVENLIIANDGNATLTGSVSTQLSSDWLQLPTGAYTLLPTDPPDIRTVTMDATAASIVSEGLYQDAIEVFHNDTAHTSPLLIPIDFFVFDDFYCPEYITLNTGWLWLTVSNTERVGATDSLVGGLVRLDPATGDTSYGVYDGSLIIGVPPNPDTLVFRTVYGSGNGANGFRALGPLVIDTSAYGSNTGFATASAKQTTTDSLLGVDVEYIFPQDPDSCEFVIIRYAITNNSGAPMNGLAIGQATDFDIVPRLSVATAAQPGKQNTGHIDAAYNLIYQQGVDTVPHAPVGDESAVRYKAGIAALQCSPAPRAWIAPTTPWLTERPGEGFHEGYLWSEITKFGFELFPPNDPDPEEDLHGVMVFDNNVDLDTGETGHFAMAYVSSNTGTSSADLIATTRKAWRYAFGWSEFTEWDSMGTPEYREYPYVAIGTHEDGLAGGCCGCVIDEIEDLGDVYTIVPDSDPCTGVIQFSPPPTPIDLCYRAIFRVRDLCGDNEDLHVIQIQVGSECWLPCICPYQGDMDASGSWDAVDLNALIDALFFGGPNPTDELCHYSTYTRGDLNADGFPDALDLNYLIELLFFGGPEPVDPCL